MKKIAILNQKGGVGKSTSVVDLASTLSKDFKRSVVVCDCDEQGDATAYLNTSMNAPIYNTILDCIEGKPINECLVHIQFNLGSQDKPKVVDTNIDLLASEWDIHNFVLEKGNEHVIRDMLAPVESSYDYCIFDCPPNISPFVVGVLCAADYLIVPAILDVDSLRGYGHIIDTINYVKENGFNYKIDVLGILYTYVNDYATMDKLCRQIFEENGYNGLPFLNGIRYAMQPLKQARFMGLPINYYKPIDYKKKPKLVSKSVTGDYYQVAKEIEKRIRKVEG